MPREARIETTVWRYRRGGDCKGRQVSRFGIAGSASTQALVSPGCGLAGAERLESDDGVGVLDTRNDLHLLVDEMADVGVVVDVEFHQQIVVARGRINFRGDLG